MPIIVGTDVVRLEQKEFGELAYEMMRCVFDVHRELGRFFDEKIYQHEIAFRLDNVEIEVPVEVRFDDFKKVYYIDLLFRNGAVFELKTVERLASRHRSQLLNYLLLAELPHGKLINLRPERVEHEFVNTALTRGDRVCFAVNAESWDEHDSSPLRPWCVAMLRDWGAGLDIGLYEEALCHYCGVDSNSPAEIDVCADNRRIGTQKICLISAETALKVTALSADQQSAFEDHLRRFLAHTSLRAIQWINVTRPLVQFKTIR